MINIRVVLLNLFIVSASVLSFEILATRISSVIFVNDFAFMILSLAILGLAGGGIFSYYHLTEQDEEKTETLIWRILLLFSGSLVVFIFSVTSLTFITNHLVYFFLLIIPFFLAGIFYAKIFEQYAAESFKVYAADLAGAALGSILSILLITYLGPVNGIFSLTILVFSAALLLKLQQFPKIFLSVIYLVLAGFMGFILVSGHSTFLNKIPIGNFPEKDFHHAYPNQNVQKIITDSRWSIYGRTDLVEYSHQNVVRHLFIDGAAGSQMLRFDGNLNNQDPVLSKLLLESSGFVPMLFLEPQERNNMLVIGPGGGKEVLGGLVTGVEQITGVEINPDFVDIVKDEEAFNGGIYTRFPNVNIQVKEGRQYVKREDKKYDLVVMALPSTQQLQSIDNYALSENFLLTVEAIDDYLNLLTPEGRMIFTVHNPWELKRLIATVIESFEGHGKKAEEVLNHLLVLETEHAPTIVIQKNPFTVPQVERRIQVMNSLVKTAPQVTYFPGYWQDLPNTTVNQFISTIRRSGSNGMDRITENQPFDVSPVYDDSPYFYKIERGIPELFNHLFYSVLAFGLLIVIVPMVKVRKQVKKPALKLINKLLLVFISLGIGFMVVEITLFQKLVLFLGSPTVSLSILLSSLLIGMGVGSYSGNKFYPQKAEKRLFMMSGVIVIFGFIVILVYPALLEMLLVYDLIYRALITFILMLPFGFVLGIPFPTCLHLLKENNLDSYIPWMYGVNGAMSVLGSVLAVMLAMAFGYTPAFIIGLSFYALIVMTLYSSARK